jgi:hypothetical protein
MEGAMDLMLILVIVAVAVGLGAVAWYLQRQRSLRLRERFGPEYERTRTEMGDARRAEAALAAREKRVEKLHIRPLTDEERARYAEVWRHVQTLFVDDPKGAIKEADHLVNEVMGVKGYPMADFNQRRRISRSITRLSWRTTALPAPSWTATRPARPAPKI